MGGLVIGPVGLRLDDTTAYPCNRETHPDQIGRDRDGISAEKGGEDRAGKGFNSKR
jgi:hypothetical protein